MPVPTELFPVLTAGWAAWGVPALLFALALLLLWARHRPRIKAWRLRRRLRGLGSEALQGVLIDDGLEGSTWIDYLLLRPEGILLLELKAYRGLIFGAESIDQWTQVVGTRSFKFPNPLHKHQADVLAVKALVPDVPVSGRLVFSGGSEFPKGVPPGVVSLEQLWDEFGTRPSGEPGPALREAWTRLKQAATRPRGREAGGDPLGAAPQGSGRLGILLAVLGLAWLVWRFSA